MHKWIWRIVTAVVVLAGCAAPHARPTLIEKERVPKASLHKAVSWTDAELVDAVYVGHDRAAAKTSISTAGLEPEYASLTDLLDSLRADQDMIEQFAEIETQAAEKGEPAGARFRAPRQPIEDRNVRVQAWVYAVKLEDDGDFHVIIGTNPKHPPRSFLNVEVTGLPPQPTADTAKLRTVRQELLDLLGQYPRYTYARLSAPLPVEVQGSLFYDIDHAPGTVGPNGMRPESAWEIHPVTDLRAGHD
jgi:hypothetical protein